MPGRRAERDRGPRRARAQPPRRGHRPAARPARRAHRPVRARGSRRSRSTRSTRRASAGTSSRCRRTRASSSVRWTSPTWTSSRACRRRSRSTRSPRAATRARRSARSPRSTTTCACSTPRIGIPHCPKCGRVITRQTPQQIVDRVLQLPEGTRFQVLAPVVRGRKGEYEGMLTELSKQGFTRARIDGEVVELSDRAKDRLARYENHTIEIVVDRLVRRTGDRAPAHGLARDRAAARRRGRRGRDRPEGRRARVRSPRPSRSPSTSRAPTTGCRSTSSRRGTSRSTRRTARASAATGSARASRSIPS